MSSYSFISYPSRAVWEDLVKRPTPNQQNVLDSVTKIIDTVRHEGDKALLRYASEFDGVSLDSLEVSSTEIQHAESLLSAELKESLRLAHANIEKFHRSQVSVPNRIETAPGVFCWQRSVAIQQVGLYVPGGTAPLFSTVLMLATPAQIAGCKEIILCTPPDKTGNIHPAILWAAHLSGVSKIYKVGGAQAIAAMAYGTETIPKVNKIFGPGNRYVMTAKQMVSAQDVAIDMPAGPSEVCVIADHTANPAFVAADLLSQAEHGKDSQVMLLVTDKKMGTAIMEELNVQLATLPRHEMACAALEKSKFVLMHSAEEAIELANLYAPEHLIIATEDAEELSMSVVNAGSVFIGNNACESAGDYASGTNHTLPTNGYAKMYSGVNMDSYCKKITYQKITDKGVLSIGASVVCMAQHEGLQAHANAMKIRLKNLEA